MSRMLIRLILLGCFVFVGSDLLRAKMFIWKDAEGNQHVTDTPPPKDAVLEKSIGPNNSKPRSSVESYVPGKSPSAEVQRAYENLATCGPYRKIETISSPTSGPLNVTTTEFESSQRVRITELETTRTRQTQSTSSNETGRYDGIVYRQKENGQFIRAKLTGNENKGLEIFGAAAQTLVGVNPRTGEKYIGKESLKGYQCAVYLFNTQVSMLNATVITKLWIRLDEALPLREESRLLNDITTDYEYLESLKIPPPPPRAEEVPFSEFIWMK